MGFDYIARSFQRQNITYSVPRDSEARGEGTNQKRWKPAGRGNNPREATTAMWISSQRGITTKGAK